MYARDETRLLPETLYPHTFFDVVGFQRSLSRRNLAFAPKMWRARSEAVALLRRLDPNVVVTVGGYASMPAVLAARKLGVPIVVVSYDFVPGTCQSIRGPFGRSMCGGVRELAASESNGYRRASTSGDPGARSRR